MVVRAADIFGAGPAPVGIVSGSGIHLRPLLDEILREISFEAAGVPAAGTAGHEGRFIFGRCGGLPLILQSGRIHLYEGHSIDAVTSTVDALYQMGVRSVILTNAAGGLDEVLSPGDLVAVEEVRAWPFRGHAFPERMCPAFVVPGCTASGVYVWMHGPCYETRAEIQALQRLGATCVGMSLAAEVERCQQLGIRAGAISCVTNDCTTQESLSHAQVVAVAERASDELCTIIRACLMADADGAPEYA